jgi:hypothetical protein
MGQIAVIIAGIAATGWAARGVSDALEDASELTKWAVIGGGLFVAYRASKSAGLIR